MRYYIAGKAGNDLSELHRLHGELQSMGHVPTVDWTKLGVLKPYGNHPTESSVGSEECLRGVRESELFVLLANDRMVGALVEYGAAIATNATIGRPVIYAIDQNQHRSMFHYHSSVRLKSSIDQFLDEIRSL